MIFEFKPEMCYMEQLDVEDIGNVCIRATSEHELEYYIITKTILGKTFILKFGPILPDLQTLWPGFSVNFSKIDYKEGKIIKEISTMLNNSNPKDKIAKAEVITEYEAFSIFPDIIELYKNTED